MKLITVRFKFATVIFSFLFCSQILATENQDSSELVTHASMMSKAQQSGRLPIIVRLKTNSNYAGLSASSAEMETRQVQLIKTLKKFNTTNVKEFQHFPVTAMEVDSNGLNSLLNNPDVEVFEDKLFEPHLLDSTTLIGSTVTAAANAGGNGQVVAVLDTGVDRNHPFLINKVVDEACFSKTTSDSTSICPNGSNSQTGTGAATPCVSNCNHGTHVAGIAAGKGSSFSGVAPDANIMAVQVFSSFTGSYCGGASSCVLAYTSDILSGLEHVYSKRNQFSIASVNMSLGGGAYTSTCDGSILKSTIDLLKSTGIATVVASGNNGYSNQLNSPACISSVVKVGATTKSDGIASYSNSSTLLDILAPGSSIQSSVPGTGYSYMSGTSMATPHVAGAFAVLRSQFPSKSVDELLLNLQSTGFSITDTRNNVTRSRIQVDSALQALAPIVVSNDFNPDGRADIFWRNNITGENKIDLMNGTSVIGSQTLNNVTDLNWIVAGIGDFNGDNSADVLWRNELTGANKIDLMSGTTISSTVNLNSYPDLNWKIRGVGDFDGDGKDDIQWGNQATGENRITFMDGATVVSDSHVAIVGLDWEVQDTGDFNGDDKDDILWRNGVNGRVWVYLMDGATISTSSHIAFTSLSWNIKNIGDFNGDGKDDILWRNNQHGEVWLYNMDGVTIANGTTNSSGEHVAYTSLTWDIKAASDFNGDGKDDLLWRNDTTGENWMYLMNGANILVNQAVATVPDLNWKIKQ